MVLLAFNRGFLSPSGPELFGLGLYAKSVPGFRFS